MEQQISAECEPGRIAFSVSIAPPTGIVATPLPAGQVSGMSVPRFTTGAWSSSIMRARDAAMFFASIGDSTSTASVSPVGAARSSASASCFG
jgi:hypothetical protein